LPWYDRDNVTPLQSTKDANGTEVFEAVSISRDRLQDLADYLGVQLTTDRDGHYVAVPPNVDVNDPSFQRNFVSFWLDQATSSSSASKDRSRRITTFKAMDVSMAEASISLDTYADEALGVGFIENPIQVRISNKAVHDVVLEILTRNDITKRARSMMRNLIKYGDLGYKITLPTDPAKTILDINLEYIDPLSWECRVSDDAPNLVLGYTIGSISGGRRSGPNPSSKKDNLQLWEFLQLSVFDEDSKPYGRSLLEPMRVDFDKLVTMEALLALSRAARVDRLVIKVPTGSTNAVNAAQKLQQVKAQLKNAIFKDSSLGARSYAKTPALNEMIFMPSDAGFEIEKLPSNIDFSTTDDVDYFRNKVFTSTGLPKGFFLHDDTFSRGAALQQQDIMFARKLIQYQQAFCEGLVKMITVLSVYVAGTYISDLEVEVTLKRPHQLAESIIDYYKKVADAASEMIMTYAQAAQQMPAPDTFAKLLASLGMPQEVASIFNQVGMPIPGVTTDPSTPTKQIGNLMSSNDIVRTNKNVSDLRMLRELKTSTAISEKIQKFRSAA
jgi:hypothetical protein